MSFLRELCDSWKGMSNTLARMQSHLRHIRLTQPLELMGTPAVALEDDPIGAP